MQIGNDYRVRVGDNTRQVDSDKLTLARALDTDKNGEIDRAELESFVSSDRSPTTHCNVPHDHVATRGDNAALARELAYSLSGTPNPDRGGYHSFDQLIAEFDGMVADNPHTVKKEVLGKSPEGRDLVAYKFSEGADGDTSAKPGIVITGMHHAREWMTVEAPLQLGKDLLADTPENKKRLHDGEIWIVPCTNPDGYEYSRNSDSMWRKNRNPQTADQLGNPIKTIGVDLNRNYADGNPDHAFVYRPPGDTPGKTSDDFPNTSDRPSSEVYRGPSGASEPETQAMVNLELRPNIKGTIDYHSYGNDIFYPWDHSAEPCPNKAIYQEIGPKIANATGWAWGQGSDLYLNAGDSTDNAEINGRLTFCFEMGRSFQPNPSQIPEISGKASKGTQVFIDEVLARSTPAPAPEPPAPQPPTPPVPNQPAPAPEEPSGCLSGLPF